MNSLQDKKQDGLRAIMVCVEYADMLALTLPYNHHHFSEIMVVVNPKDVKTFEVLSPYLKGDGIGMYPTDAFYRNGAKFNKWLALEEGLDYFGRYGWICIMDADVFWPKEVNLSLEQGKVYTPLRRMMPTIPQIAPKESDWLKYPLHGNQGEWAGYSQIFHADDPVLKGLKYWHEIDWSHAGGADSFFQQKWARENKVRPPFEVLHIGEAGLNWMGRCTPFANGELPVEANDRKREMMEMFRKRKGKIGNDRFKHEKLK